MTTDPLALELAVRMPWLHAEPGTWWLITAVYPGPRSNIEEVLKDKIAIALDELQHTYNDLRFAAFGGNGTTLVPADRITRAKRLLFVPADDPFTAHFPDEQDYIDAALARRDEETR